jgi:predicted nicotinamide N-methyase
LNPHPLQHQSAWEYEQLRLRLARKFDVVEKLILISGRPFRILKVRDTNALVDAITPATFSDDERLPYWADLWTSSLALASFCLENPALEGKRLLELGCGLGLAGIAAAQAGARVTMSDYETDALSFAAYNASLNLSPQAFRNVAVLQLDWRDVACLHNSEKFDMIIAADVVYERRNFFPLIDVLTKLIRADGVAIFAEPGRSIGEQFFAVLREEGFRLAATKQQVELDGKRSEVFTTTIKCPGAARCNDESAGPG